MEGLRFCSHCRHHIKNPKEILYVEDSYRRGFCSETCIADYFNPLCAHYKEFEGEWRKRHGLQSEPCLTLLDQPLPDSVLEDSDEIFSFPSETYETVHALLKTVETPVFGPVTYLGLGLILENRVSFLFLVTCTGSGELADEIRSGPWATFEDRSQRRQ